MTSHVVNGRQLRAARAWLGWSQKELSDISGIPKRTIAAIEMGRNARQGTLAALCMPMEHAGIVFEFDDDRGVGLRGDPALSSIHEKTRAFAARERAARKQNTEVKLDDGSSEAAVSEEEGTIED